jgi:tellurite methyltransferase
MASGRPEIGGGERFAAYIAARHAAPPRPLLTRAAALVELKEHALDAGAGALNATKYLLSTGFHHVTAFDGSPSSQKLAADLPPSQVTFVPSRFEDFTFAPNAYDLVNAEFCLPFISRDAFASVFGRLLGSVAARGIFTGQLFGPNDSWNTPERKMSFHSRAEAEGFLTGFEVIELEEESHPGKTALGDEKYWHIFHIIARKPPE